ncbi:hypothetical protein BKA70DRAFT_1416564 [Coprinopsis sp. MPI-PUGE-AT-0042]|nr:hypothetical protein BKA70DRAFT_1416564 [Coprinopsis sp. MPI-PUGE-AT-0042]
MSHEETPFELLLEEAQLDDHNIDGSLPLEVNYELEAIIDDFKVGQTFKECLKASVPFEIKASCGCHSCKAVIPMDEDEKEATRLGMMISRVEGLVRRMEDGRIYYIEHRKRQRARTVVLVALGREGTSKGAEWLASGLGWSALHEDV